MCVCVCLLLIAHDADAVAVCLLQLRVGFRLLLDRGLQCCYAWGYAMCVCCSVNTKELKTPKCIQI